MTITEQMTQTVRAVVNKSAQVYGLEEKAEVGLIFADDEYIRKLNFEYRDKDCSTDVLSFALNDHIDHDTEPEILGNPPGMEILLGDIVISLETAARQAEEFGHSMERELAYLTIHGMLHLLGYDHEDEAERADMRKEEEHVLSLLGITRG
ncbi:MAG TPA: rRNA maturation RNase YbeY [Methylomusa anaerophila]|uniref:Endoribonuclease YbeY n=1 Tax=Methylomusa anaerophila TaxID=1930071 RepID=A0A348ANZ4_9FIRM|nr:rRNA maturation RNase YbeY [Methylomusa anaerophila]BBB92792.1 endoribonuclease YbeY [Methylomusa anaerophila]HML87357.1 rRNA maturation RNase YbeY [Methylomusa anaerophila]